MSARKKAKRQPKAVRPPKRPRGGFWQFMTFLAWVVADHKKRKAASRGGPSSGSRQPGRRPPVPKHTGQKSASGGGATPGRDFPHRGTDADFDRRWSKADDGERDPWAEDAKPEDDPFTDPDLDGEGQADGDEDGDTVEFVIGEDGHIVDDGQGDDAGGDAAESDGGEAA